MFDKLFFDVAMNGPEAAEAAPEELDTLMNADEVEEGLGDSLFKLPDLTSRVARSRPIENLVKLSKENHLTQKTGGGQTLHSAENGRKVSDIRKLMGFSSVVYVLPTYFSKLFGMISIQLGHQVFGFRPNGIGMSRKDRKGGPYGSQSPKFFRPVYSLLFSTN